MGWIHMETPKSEVHQCAKPKIPRNVEPGSIWQCDDCKDKWKVAETEGFFRKTRYWTYHIDINDFY